MYRAICALVLLLVIHCTNGPTGGPGLSMEPPDLSMGPADMSMPGPPPRVCSPDRWCWENPLPQGNDLGGVWATDANNVWVVGNAGMILDCHGQHPPSCSS